MASVDSKTLDSRSGMTPKEQLDKIYEAVAPLYKERDKTYAEIKNSCIHTGSVGWIQRAGGTGKKYVKHYFKEQVLPLLSPQIVDANHPFPHLLNKELYVIATLRFEEKK